MRARLFVTLVSLSHGWHRHEDDYQETFNMATEHAHNVLVLVSATGHG